MQQQKNNNCLLLHLQVSTLILRDPSLVLTSLYPPLTILPATLMGRKANPRSKFPWWFLVTLGTKKEKKMVLFQQRRKQLQALQALLLPLVTDSAVAGLHAPLGLQVSFCWLYWAWLWEFPLPSLPGEHPLKHRSMMHLGWIQMQRSIGLPSIFSQNKIGWMVSLSCPLLLSVCVCVCVCLSESLGLSLSLSLHFHVSSKSLCKWGSLGRVLKNNETQNSLWQVLTREEKMWKPCLRQRKS